MSAAPSDETGQVSPSPEPASSAIQTPHWTVERLVAVLGFDPSTVTSAVLVDGQLLVRRSADGFSYTHHYDEAQTADLASRADADGEL